ncbi:hypothetical protein DMH18_14305 [Streptomyces sp. WAC 06783]|uniref:hypothetical protein n=1 Tax=Streptomyces sp. WAC 06783 TaxID=2203211 RepID=UPI000F74B2E8|nr:hypothetical protein [Streptomyces sp. WAC 06783]RSO10611.1 hypothetical protein DMH18_14305 [Streptomyces sp. WAC 06783]
MSTSVRRTLAAGALAAAVVVLVSVVALGGPARDATGAQVREQGRIAQLHEVLCSHGLGLPHR